MDQPEIRLVNERGRLQRVAGSFLMQVVFRQVPEFPIDDRR